MYKLVEPKKRRYYPPKGVEAYVRVTTRIVYLNSEAMKLLGDTETVNVSINPQQHIMVITPGGPWKLSTVCETKNARRIENGSAMMQFLKAGFPDGLLGCYLKCWKDIAGSLVVSLIPDIEKAS